MKRKVSDIGNAVGDRHAGHVRAGIESPLSNARDGQVGDGARDRYVTAGTYILCDGDRAAIGRERVFLGMRGGGQGQKQEKRQRQNPCGEETPAEALVEAVGPTGCEYSVSCGNPFKEAYVHTWPNFWAMLGSLDALFARGKQRAGLPAQFGIFPQALSGKAAGSSGGKTRAERKIKSRRHSRLSDI